MILVAKKFIFLFYKKSFIKNFQVFYISIQIFSMLVLFYYSNCCLLLRKILDKNLRYCFILNWSSPMLYILRIKISTILEYLFHFSSSNFFNRLQSLPKSNSFFSIIRSPFVYKKSMEQLFYNFYKVRCYTNILSYNLFIQKYQYIFLKNKLCHNSIFKFFCKIKFIF